MYEVTGFDMIMLSAQYKEMTETWEKIVAGPDADEFWHAKDNVHFYREQWQRIENQIK
jgi:hypothetical protein